MESESESSGSGSGEAEMSGFGSGSIEMRAVMMPPGVGSEGWFETDSSGASEFAAESSSFSSSEFSSTGTSRGTGHASQRGTSVVPVWVPIPKQELASEQDWTLEEKRMKLAQMLKHQAERHCFINLDQPGGTQPLCVPFVGRPPISAEMFADYEKVSCEKQGSLPAQEVDRLLIASEREFAIRATSPRVLARRADSVPDEDEDDDDIPLE